MDIPSRSPPPRSGRTTEMQPEDESHMRRALALAGQAAQGGGGAPIGCVIVLDGKVVARRP